jgi:methionyl aminopeptidase
MISSLNKWNSSPLNLDRITFPPNQVLSYKLNDVIKISEDISVPQKIYDMRKGAEAHRQVRRYIQNLLEPGQTYFNICDKIETKIHSLLGNNKYGGVGFPAGLSVNNIAAHDSALENDKRTIKEDDIIKIDIGTHVNGNIIDSAFTVTFNDKYKSLVDCTKEATMEGIKMSGPDSLILDISKRIKEVIESYEVEINGKTYQIHPVTNLGGHNIEPYKIHAGKLVLGAPSIYVDPTIRMEEGECYAIETFATTGKGPLYSTPLLKNSHYSLNDEAINSPLKLKQTKKLYNYIKKTRGSLPFCGRWLDRGFGKYSLSMKELVTKNIVKEYPPLIDLPTNLTSQFEHTIYLHEFGKEILSKGDDY